MNQSPLEDLLGPWHSWMKEDAADDILDLSSVNKVHDWRNYIPCGVEKIWEKLSVETRLAIIMMAETQAEEEEWN